ncbi:MAG: hypothetical protein AB7S38_10790 [Vulcanimicrobiota bacterium]
MVREFTAVPRQVREQDGKVEILFVGRPAYFWCHRPEWANRARQAIENGSELNLRWESTTGELLELE